MNVEVLQAGVDTWSPCWYIDGESPAAHALTALATQPAKRGRLVPAQIAGHRVGWFPGSNLVYAEGHPAPGRLAAAEELESGLVALEGAIADYGIKLPTTMYRDNVLSVRPGRAGVRRLDVTVDMLVESQVGGALLRAIAALGMPRYDHRAWYDRSGAIESVDFMGARGIAGRWYDKGVESGSHARHERLRPEAQHRWGKDARRDVCELDTAYLRDRLFRQRFAPLWKATQGVKVVDQMQLAAEVLDRVAAGEITIAQAEQIVASQMFALVSPERSPYKRASRWRRESLVRETGLVLDAEQEGLEVDLHEILGQVLETDAWDRRE